MQDLPTTLVERENYHVPLSYCPSQKISLYSMYISTLWKGFFLKAGLTVTKVRSALKPKHVDALFLKKNINLLEKWLLFCLTRNQYLHLT